MKSALYVTYVQNFFNLFSFVYLLTYIDLVSLLVVKTKKINASVNSYNDKRIVDSDKLRKRS